ncbi:kinesin-like protein Klp5 [Tulasnella sp. 419]|nr:kinesin-like protein Klp5 [Tulasnella sp. 419]
MSQAASIAVAVRVRPPTAWEADRLPEPVGFNDTTFMGDGNLASPRKASASKSLRPIVQVMDDKVLIFDPKDPDVSRAFEQKGYLPPGTKRYKDQRYTFDRVFNESAHQIDVFENTTKPLLDGLLDGFNATVFAYGATGCGKTHTISGTEADPGIIYLTMAELFNKIEERRDDLIIDVSLSFLEIYNEEIRDLLSDHGTQAPRGGLSIREDKSNRVVVSNLTERKPTNADEVKEMVLLGNNRRTQSPTHANETSSRSHAVLQINVSQSPRTASTTEERTMATLSIIDLAGSERASATKNMGERMVEGANINKSLLALGNCINALCESGGRTRHVPYRNSKLTRLLKFSLGGNCKTVMIVCVAPTSAHFEDTHNTLKYANRAKNIKTKVSRNFVNVDRHVAQYVEAINSLNCQVADLKAKLADKAGQESGIAKKRKAEAKVEMERMRADLRLKLDQTRATVAEGGACDAKINAVDLRLKPIRIRLAQLDSQAAHSPLPSDLLAERTLLHELLTADEAITRPGSTARQRQSRGSNAEALFDATLRAATERKTDRLEEEHVETIRADAKLRRMELDVMKLQAREGVLKESLSEQAEILTTLVSALSKCTTLMKESANALENASSSSESDMGTAIQPIAGALAKMVKSNDQTFVTLLGSKSAVISTVESSLPDYTYHPPAQTAPRRSSISIPSTSKARRHSSSSSAAIPSHHRSPRKQNATRLSIVPSVGPYVRPEGRKGEKKSLRWRDEAGEGKLDDRSLVLDNSSTKPESASEAEWEDIKTEDSLSVSNSSVDGSLPLLFPKPSEASNENILGRRVRSSRFDAAFLKPQAPTLSMLAEVEDENLRSPKKLPPLGERSNQPPPSEPSSSSSSIKGPGTPPRPVAARKVPLSVSKGRRRSNIGPMRIEKTRRRSSLIPQLSPNTSSLSRSTTATSSDAHRRQTEPDRRSPVKKARRISSGTRSSLSVVAGSGPSVARRPWRPSLARLGGGPAPSPGSGSGSLDTSLDSSVGSRAVSVSKRTWR